MALTVNDFDNAKLDLTTIEEVVNGNAGSDSPVTSRLGQSIKTLAAAIASVQGFTSIVGWQSGISYNDFAVLVTNGGTTYKLAVAHVSGNFATDLAAGKWLIYYPDSLGTAAALDAQTSLTDTTANRLMKVGAGGWLGKAPLLTSSVNYDDLRSVGSHYFINSGQQNAPNSTNAFLLHVITGTTGTDRCMQIAYDYSGTNKVYTRGYNGTAWSDWARTDPQAFGLGVYFEHIAILKREAGSLRYYKIGTQSSVYNLSTVLEVELRRGDSASSGNLLQTYRVSIWKSTITSGQVFVDNANEERATFFLKGDEVWMELTDVYTRAAVKKVQGGAFAANKSNTLVGDPGGLVEITAKQIGYHTGNILGTVSQSGGVPTGAIIQHIPDTGNGEAVLFADGMMICTRADNISLTINTPSGNVFESEIFGDLPFAATFSVINSVSIDSICSSNGAYWIGNTLTGPSLTNFGQHKMFDSLAASSRSYFVWQTAIGRWY